MSAPHSPTPIRKNNDGSSVSSVFDFLFALFGQSPQWLRTLIVLGVFTAAGLGIYRWISAQSAGAKQQPDGKPTYSLDKGRQIDPPGNANNEPNNVLATQRISDDDAHYKWHATHEKHEQDWNVIFKVDDDNLIEYKYYKDTDRCILLWRKENGEGTPQWIRDTDFSKKSATASRSDSKHDLTDLLVEPASASPQEFSSRSREHLQKVQVGCQNPHPGTFQWWWGPAADQCWSPMYRRFGDGCTHHQMFNRCYNTWDPNIWWDYCTNNPQHY
ncbi:MAG: hypothetical protein WB421_09710 [Terriglobales bacterium]